MKSKLKLNNKEKRTLVLSGLILAAALILLFNYLCRQNIETSKNRACDITSAYADELRRDFEYGVLRAEALEKLASEGNLSHQMFVTAGGIMMRDYIGLIGMAPDGKISDVYPEAEGEGFDEDLGSNEDASVVLDNAKSKNSPVMYGPVTFPRAGQCFLIADPVYVTEDSGADVFWGYVFVAIRIPNVYRHTLNALIASGYDYCLDSTESPLSEEFTQIESSKGLGHKLDDPVGTTFASAGCKWTLNVEPKKGWLSVDASLLLAVGIVFASLIMVLVFLMLRMRTQDRKLNEIAYMDALTGLSSRAGFMMETERRMAKHPDENLTAAFLDLDDFKLINDVYGHAVGDEALKDLAGYLRRAFPDNALIGRTGGDEICVLIYGRTPETCGIMVNRAVDGVRTLQYRGNEIRYTISAGYADFPSQASNRSDLMVLADEALYAAKSGGKCKARHYEKSMSGIKRVQLGFSVKTMSHGMPGAFLIYKAEGDEEILFANDHLIHLFGCTDYEDFLHYTHGSFRHIVHPDDLDRVGKSIWDQIHGQQKEPEGEKSYYDDFVEYRIIAKDGQVKDVIDMGRLVHDDRYGDVFFVFIRDKASIGTKFL